MVATSSRAMRLLLSSWPECIEGSNWPVARNRDHAEDPDTQYCQGVIICDIFWPLGGLLHWLLEDRTEWMNEEVMIKMLSICLGELWSETDINKATVMTTSVRVWVIYRRSQVSQLCVFSRRRNICGCFIMNTSKYMHLTVLAAINMIHGYQYLFPFV